MTRLSEHLTAKTRPQANAARTGIRGLTCGYPKAFGRIFSRGTDTFRPRAEVSARFCARSIPFPYSFARAACCRFPRIREIIAIIPNASTFPSIRAVENTPSSRTAESVRIRARYLPIFKRNTPKRTGQVCKYSVFPPAGRSALSLKTA